MNAREVAPPSAWFTIRELARSDGRKLAVNRWFLAGLGIAAIGTATFVAAVRGGAATWSDDVWTLDAGFLLFAILSMVAVNHAALRDHRENTRDQHNTLPVGAGTRTLGLLTAVTWPAAISTVLLAFVVVVAAVLLEVPATATVYVIHNAVLVMMLGALGVALATAIQNSFVAPVVAFASYLIHPGEQPSSWHVIWPFASLDSVSLATWHVVYLIGLALLLGTLAVWRAGSRRPVIIVSVVACVAIAASLAVMLSQVCPSPGRCLL